MRSYRENPDGPEAQEAHRQNEREVFALKMMAKLTRCDVCGTPVSENALPAQPRTVCAFCASQGFERPAHALEADRQADRNKLPKSCSTCRHSTAMAGQPVCLRAAERFQPLRSCETERKGGKFMAWITGKCGEEGRFHRV